MKFNPELTKRITLMDSNGCELVVNVFDIKKQDSPINIYNLSGYVGEENCSGADVGLEFRYEINSCASEGRTCCGLSQ